MPSGAKRDPWQAQSQLRSAAFQFTWQPRCTRDGTGRAPGLLITGDWHSTFVNDIKADFSNPDSATVATEFVGTSISSNGDGPVYGPYYGPMIGANPHIKFFDGDRRGYVRCLVDRRHWHTDLRMVTTVSRSDAPAYTLASFDVESGRPGAQPA